MKHADLLLKLEFLSNPELLCAVRGAMERLTEGMGFSAPECRSVTRADDKAVTNIIRHAYGGRPDQPIVLSCYRMYKAREAESAEGLEIVLEDQGEPADPAKMGGRSLDEIKPGGLGLHYIRESMDVVEFSRSHILNLGKVKYIESSGVASLVEGLKASRDIGSRQALSA